VRQRLLNGQPLGRVESEKLLQQLESEWVSLWVDSRQRDPRLEREGADVPASLLGLRKGWGGGGLTRYIPIYVCVFVRKNMNVSIHLYIYICIRTYVCMYVCMYTHTHTYIYSYLAIYIYIYLLQELESEWVGLWVDSRQRDPRLERKRTDVAARFFRLWRKGGANIAIYIYVCMYMRAALERVGWPSGRFAPAGSEA